MKRCFLVLVGLTASLGILGWLIHQSAASRYGTIRGVVRVDGKPAPDVEFYFDGQIGGGAVTTRDGYVSDIPPQVFRYRVTSTTGGRYSVSWVKPGVVYHVSIADRQLQSAWNGELAVIPGMQHMDVDFITPE